MAKDPFSLYVLFSLIFLFINYVYISTWTSACVGQHLKETIVWGTITWSQVGKQNIQANKVYCMQWGIVIIDKGCPFHQFSKNQLLKMLQLAKFVAETLNRFQGNSMFTQNFMKFKLTVISDKAHNGVISKTILI